MSFSVKQVYADQNISDNYSVANFTYIIDEWKREVRIDAFGGVTLVDRCLITNNANESVNEVTFFIPANATSISVQNVYGAISKTSVTISNYETHVKVRVYLSDALYPQKKLRLLVSYTLPSSIYIQQKGWQDYVLTINLSKPDDWFVKRLTVTVYLPEGAEYQESSLTPLVQRSSFSTIVEFTKNNITQIEEPTIMLRYQFFILWSIFRPALWIGFATVIFLITSYTRKTTTPSHKAVITTVLSSDLLRKFLNKYDEKRRLQFELEKINNLVKKGKISRRNYRMRRSSIDDRMLSIQKELTEIGEKIVTAGGEFSEQMKRLKTAETEIETLKKDIERIDARFLRKEISAEEHQKMLNEYRRLNERAENAIEEAILRLREIC